VSTRIKYQDQGTTTLTGKKIVGPEAPLALGIVDFFEEKNLKIFWAK